MNYKKEIIYIKAKELLELTYESVGSSPYEDANLRKKLLRLSLQIPFQIGRSLNTHSLECIRFHLGKAESKLIELSIAIDLSSSEYLQIDLQKRDSLLKEILELIPITLKKAEEEEQIRMDEIMNEYFVN